MAERTYGYRDAQVWVSSGFYELAFGTPHATPTDRIMLVDSPPPQITKTLVGNNDVVGVGDEPTAFQELKRDGTISLTVPKASPDVIAFALSYLLGTIVTSTPEIGKTARKHLITRNTASNVLKSFTYIRQLKSGLIVAYPGCLMQQVKLSASRSDWWKITMDIIPNGVMSTLTPAGSAITDEIFLALGMTKVFLGAAYDGSQAQSKSSADVTSPSDLSTPMVSVEWTGTNTITVDDLRVPNSGLYIGEAERDDFAQTLTATWDYRTDDVWWAKYTDGDDITREQFALELETFTTGALAGDAVGTYQGFDMIFPLLEVNKASHPEGRNKQTIQTDFNILKDATYGSILAAVYNTQAGYMQAGSGT